MVRFFIKRLYSSLIVLVFVSIISFVLIQLPPGDFTDTYVAALRAQGETVPPSRVKAIREMYGMNDPAYIQYYKWIKGIIFEGDFGWSFQWGKPVRDLIGERLALTLAVSVLSLIFSWIIAFPIGIYSAVKKYSIGDYIFTFFGFIGLSTPNFMLALVLMYISLTVFGFNVGGLFSAEYAMEPWSFAKIVDLLKHIWIPMIVIGTAGTAGLIRVLRNNLLDELGKPYVVTARSKGLSLMRLLFKYPVRLALIPFVSTVGYQLPKMISGASITAVVLSLPTAGPLLLNALKSQDMYLAGSFVMILAFLTVIGTFISDLLLIFVDPRIKYT